MICGKMVAVTDETFMAIFILFGLTCPIYLSLQVMEMKLT